MLIAVFVMKMGWFAWGGEFWFKAMGDMQGFVLPR